MIQTSRGKSILIGLGLLFTSTVLLVVTNSVTPSDLSLGQRVGLAVAMTTSAFAYWFIGRGLLMYVAYFGDRWFPGFVQRWRPPPSAVRSLRILLVLVGTFLAVLIVTRVLETSGLLDDPLLNFLLSFFTIGLIGHALLAWVSRLNERRYYRIVEEMTSSPLATPGRKRVSTGLNRALCLWVLLIAALAGVLVYLAGDPSALWWSTLAGLLTMIAIFGTAVVYAYHLRPNASRLFKYCLLICTLAILVIAGTLSDLANWVADRDATLLVMEALKPKRMMFDTSKTIPYPATLHFPTLVAIQMVTLTIVIFLSGLLAHYLTRREKRARKTHRALAWSSRILFIVGLCIIIESVWIVHSQREISSSQEWFETLQPGVRAFAHLAARKEQNQIPRFFSTEWLIILAGYLTLRFVVGEQLSTKPILYFRSFSAPDVPQVFRTVVAPAASRYGIVCCLTHRMQTLDDLSDGMAVIGRPRTLAVPDRLTDSSISIGEKEWIIWVRQEVGACAAVIIDLAGATTGVETELRIACDVDDLPVLVLERSGGPSTPSVEHPRARVSRVVLESLETDPGLSIRTWWRTKRRSRRNRRCVSLWLQENLAVFVREPEV